MDAIRRELANPLFWFTAVAVGLLINIVAAYGKDLLDRVLSNYSTVRRLRREQEARDREARIDTLASDDHRLLRAQFTELHQVIGGTFGCLLSFIAYLTNVSVGPSFFAVELSAGWSFLEYLFRGSLLVVAIVASLLGVRLIERAKQLRTDIREALDRVSARRKLLDKQAPPATSG